MIKAGLYHNQSKMLFMYRSSLYFHRLAPFTCFMCTTIAATLEGMVAHVKKVHPNWESEYFRPVDFSGE